MQLADAYVLVLCGVPINEIPISDHYAEVISRFRAFEAWNEIDEIHHISKIDRRHVKKLKRAYNNARKGIVFGKSVTMDLAPPGPIYRRKKVYQVRGAPNVQIHVTAGRKVVCFGF